MARRGRQLGQRPNRPAKSRIKTNGRKRITWKNAKGKRCACPSGAKSVSTKPRGERGAKPRGPGVVCVKQVDNAPRFVKKNRNGSCPSGAKRRKGKGGATVCIKKVRGPRFVKPVCK